MTEREMATPDETTTRGMLSRRTLLVRAGALTLGAGAVSLLAACGGDSGSDAPSTAPAGGSGGTGDTTPTTAPATQAPVGESTATQAPATGEEQKGGKLTIALNSDLTTMDPHKSSAAVDRQVFQLIFNKLVDIDAQLNIVPYLAQKWEVSSDGTEYTFDLVTGVKFHDGEPFNAAACVTNYERMLNKDNALPRRSEIAQVTKAGAVDDDTLKLTLSQAFSPFLAALSDRAGMMISPKAIAELGDDINRKPVGTGAFTFVEWVKDDHLTVKRNEDYWEEGLPYLDQVIYKPIVDATVRLAALRTGEVQMIDQLSAKDVEATKADSSLKYSEVAGLGFQYVMLNITKPPFDQAELRQALAWTLDRDGIIKAVYFGTGQGAQTAIPTSSWAFDESVAPYKQDYDKAKELLTTAGKPDGFEFTMMVTNSPDAIQLGEALRAQMGKAGIVAKLELLEFGTLLDRNDTGDYEAVSLQWSGRPDPDGNVYNYFVTGGGLNTGGYSNPDVDKLLDETRAESDTDERKKLYAQINTQINEDVPVLFIRFPAEIKVWQPVIQGFVHVPDGMMRMNRVWLKQ